MAGVLWHEQIAAGEALVALVPHFIAGAALAADQEGDHTPTCHATWPTVKPLRSRSVLSILGNAAATDEA
jgi:hypothetical protein